MHGPVGPVGSTVPARLRGGERRRGGIVDVVTRASLRPPLGAGWMRIRAEETLVTWTVAEPRAGGGAEIELVHDGWAEAGAGGHGA